MACAAETAAVVDEKVKALLKKEYDKAMTLLTENKQQLHALAKYLYEKETITGAFSLYAGFERKFWCKLTNYKKYDMLSYMQNHQKVLSEA